LFCINLSAITSIGPEQSRRLQQTNLSRAAMVTARVQ